MAVIYTGGTFDVPHLGHVNFLRQCKRLAGKEGKVVVALNPDEFVESFKGKAPLFSYNERKKLLEKLEYVDEVVKNEDGKDSKPTILKVKPDYIVIGSDWAAKDYYAQMDFSQDWLDKNNILLLYVQYTEVISSSEIKRRSRA
jgi:glycerol-3-phosphate cytidylyltransferase